MNAKQIIGGLLLTLMISTAAAETPIVSPNVAQVSDSLAQVGNNLCGIASNVGTGVQGTYNYIRGMKVPSVSNVLEDSSKLVLDGTVASTKLVVDGAAFSSKLLLDATTFLANHPVAFAGTLAIGTYYLYKWGVFKWVLCRLGLMSAGKVSVTEVDQVTKVNQVTKTRTA